jgi:hypothetical protein
VVDILGVVKLVAPVANAVPPEAAAYQSIVSPAPGVAEIMTVPVPHLELAVPVGATGTGFTFAVTAVLVDEIQPVVVFLVSA